MNDIINNTKETRYNYIHFLMVEVIPKYFQDVGFKINPMFKTKKSKYFNPMESSFTNPYIYKKSIEKKNNFFQFNFKFFLKKHLWRI